LFCAVTLSPGSAVGCVPPFVRALPQRDSQRMNGQAIEEKVELHSSLNYSESRGWQSFFLGNRGIYFLKAS
jgi:hypothetical protein